MLGLLLATRVYMFTAADSRLPVGLDPKLTSILMDCNPRSALSAECIAGQCRHRNFEMSVHRPRDA